MSNADDGEDDVKNSRRETERELVWAIMVICD